jgi:hypothetical protein
MPDHEDRFVSKKEMADERRAAFVSGADGVESVPSDFARKMLKQAAMPDYAENNRKATAILSFGLAMAQFEPDPE